MNYRVTWENKLVCLKYSGKVANKDIENAHFELNGDDRFYSCDYLMLDISDCDLHEVCVPSLSLVIATDLGATKTNQSLKVAMIAADPINIQRASSYIDKNKSIGTPWEFALFPSKEKAREWFSA